jgi:hypothetical protein
LKHATADTPFDRSSNAPAADPDDIDLSLASTQKPNPSTGFEPPSDGGMPDLMSMLGMAPGDMPEGMADNPLFALMQNMTGAGGAAMGGAQQVQAQRPKTLSERLMPLVHLLSSLALVSWAVYNASQLMEWHALPARRSTLDVVQSFVGLHQQIVGCISSPSSTLISAAPDLRLHHRPARLADHPADHDPRKPPTCVPDVSSDPVRTPHRHPLC